MEYSMKQNIRYRYSFLLTYLLLCGPVLLAQQTAQLSGKYFQVEFDQRKGLYSLWNNGKLIVSNARWEVQTEEDILKSSDPGMKFESVIDEFSDTLGIGQMMQIMMNQSGLDISVQFKIYNSKNLMTINSELINVSAKNIPLQEIRPLVVDGQKTGSLLVSEKIEGTRLLTQGYSFVDSGELFFLRDEHFEYSSNWNLAFYNTIDALGVTIGALNFDQTETQLFVGYDPKNAGDGPSPGFSFKIACSTNKPGSNMLRYKKTEKHSVWITNGRDNEVDYWLPDDRTEAYHK